MCRLCDIENVDDNPQMDVYKAAAAEIMQRPPSEPRRPGSPPELAAPYHTSPDCPAAIIEKIIEQPDPAAIHIGEEDQTA